MGELRFEVPQNGRVCGCYLLLWRDEVVYVGQTENLLNRVQVHLNEMKKAREGKKLTENALAPEKRVEFDEFVLIPLPVHQLNFEENRLIRMYRPKYNTKLNRIDVLPGLEKHPAFRELLGRSQEPKFRKLAK